MKAKLLKALMEIKPVVKDKTNPHFKKNYADINTMLQEVKPALYKHGIILLQPIIDNRVVSQLFDAESGELIAESNLELSNGLDAQKRGSEITYFRRYTLQSLLGLEAEDDDGNDASSSPVKESSKKPWLNIGSEDWKKVEASIVSGKVTDIKVVKEHFAVNKEVEAKLKELLS
jgi:hypothetical protein